jgi:tetratricopeptide (TPR) repeat protein
MAKPGRNDPCPCGSGKKYKRCCLAKDEDAERTALAAAPPPRNAVAPSSQSTPDLSGLAAELTARLAGAYDGDDTEDELTTASNAAVDLVHEGKLDEAEQAARDLIERFPKVHDGWDRLGMVHEARGDQKQAADCYRKVIDFIRAHPDQYDPDFATVFHKLVARLDPPASA